MNEVIDKNDDFFSFSEEELYTIFSEMSLSEIEDLLNKINEVSQDDYSN